MGQNGEEMDEKSLQEVLCCMVEFSKDPWYVPNLYQENKFKMGER